MIRVYYLELLTSDTTEIVSGAEFIHNAILACTPDPDVRKLIMETSPTEHDSLAAVAFSWHEAAPSDIQIYNSKVTIEPPSPDTIRANELLATSPQAITMPQIWELLRIFSRLIGLPPTP